ncbi:MAG: hypothetical protein ACYDEN_11530, partial [Acidimicrobiales bacterium]
MAVAVSGPRDMTLGGFRRVAYGGEGVAFSTPDLAGGSAPSEPAFPSPSSALPPLDHFDEPLGRGVVFARLAE